MSHGRDFSAPCVPFCDRRSGGAGGTRWFELLGFKEPCGCAYTLALRLREDSQ